MSGGKPKIIIPAVASRYHAMIGILISDMFAARNLRIVTTISIAAHIAEISTKVMPSSQTSELTPAVNSRPESGG